MATLQLLILGNGFDLHCGLKSSYKDFFRGAILDEYSEHCGFPVMQDECSGFWEKILFKHYKTNGKQDYSWCDIETIIRDTLWLIVFGDENAEPSDINHGMWRSAFECVKSNRDLEDESEKIVDPIRKFLFKYCSIFLYNNLNRNRNKSDENGLHLIINHLLQELHNLEKCFCKYLKKQYY